MMSQKTILMLAANPRNGPGQLRTDEEMREVEEALRRSGQRERFRIEKRTAVRLSDLRRALLDLKPHFVHFCGHASFEGLLLENDRGTGMTASVEGLARMFKLFSDSVECVVLNACYSEPQAEALSEHIPYVVGMSNSVGDWAATQFAVAFYDALGADRSIDFAFELASSALDTLNLPSKKAPVLKKRKGGGAYTVQGKAPSELRESLNRARAVVESQPSFDSHLRLGLLYLDLRSNGEAYEHFRTAICLAPQQSEAYYYQALSLFKNRAPKNLPATEVRQIEERLERAIRLSPVEASPFYLLGLVKHDRSSRGGSRPRDPHVDELFRLAGGKLYDRDEIERILSLVPVEDAWVISVLKREA